MKDWSCDNLFTRLRVLSKIYVDPGLKIILLGPLLCEIGWNGLA